MPSSTLATSTEIESALQDIVTPSSFDSDGLSFSAESHEDGQVNLKIVDTCSDMENAIVDEATLSGLKGSARELIAQVLQQLPEDNFVLRKVLSKN